MRIYLWSDQRGDGRKHSGSRISYARSSTTNSIARFNSRTSGDSCRQPQQRPTIWFALLNSLNSLPFVVDLDFTFTLSLASAFTYNFPTFFANEPNFQSSALNTTSSSRCNTTSSSSSTLKITLTWITHTHTITGGPRNSRSAIAESPTTFAMHLNSSSFALYNSFTPIRSQWLNPSLAVHC